MVQNIFWIKCEYKSIKIYDIKIYISLHPFVLRYNVLDYNWYEVGYLTFFAHFCWRFQGCKTILFFRILTSAIYGSIRNFLKHNLYEYPFFASNRSRLMGENVRKSRYWKTYSSFLWPFYSKSNHGKRATLHTTWTSS